MNEFKAINYIQTAVAVIDKNMIVVDANDAFNNRSNIKNIAGKKCHTAAYSTNVHCNSRTAQSCPVEESFRTRQIASTIHHFWIDDHAVVEEITTTPIIDEKGEVSYVVEEFHDLTQLLGLDKGILVMCSYCRKLRNDDGKWVSFETYLQKHTGANVSHGICDECNKDIE
ncbi:MAG: PAS domain-containing protein [Gammaproteobacteria bacterium]|nr:PAS domain-containing protein [Gammaproteobacteria bacterium]MCW8988679.1 PAS domain-containing protein [Gammaproteobacteria bacterium]MCW9031178.1 PAS domain-containing protein [Gammaproteobacteria bacterium]